MEKKTTDIRKKPSRKKVLAVYAALLICLVAVSVAATTVLTRRATQTAAASDAYGQDAAPEGMGRGRRNGPADDEEKGRGRRADHEDDVKAVETTQSSETRASSGAQTRIVRDPLVTPVGSGEDRVTVMILLNGSDLESESGFASQDIDEILEADASDRLHIVIETVGTRRWRAHGIASDHSQRYSVEDHQLVLVDDSLGQLDCTSPDTLEDFITWSAAHYPADRYFLILWDHGGGSVGGYGYDEWQRYDDSLTMDEIYAALSHSGILFDFIGMDACIMSSIEICYALYPFCDYCVLSEDFESALGWQYTGWLSALAADTSLPTLDMGTILIDDMVAQNQHSRNGSSSTLALIDERYIPAAMDAWMEFAFHNEETLLSVNYSREVERTGRAMPLPIEAGTASSGDATRVSSELVEYYITDALALAVSVDSPLSKPLVARLAQAVTYYNCTEDNIGLTGLSVTLPYEDDYFYHSLGQVYSGIGIQKRYIEWLGKFQEAYVPTDRYDYDEFDGSWNGWDEYSAENP